MFIMYVASREHVWTVDDNEAVAALQEIWDYNYGASIPYKVTTKSDVFRIVSTPSHLAISFKLLT